MKKILFIAVPILAILLFFILVRITTYHPDAIEQLDVSNSNTAQPMPINETIKILSWNVQFMAGKDYLFFYDEWDGSGPDTRPDKKAIKKTFTRVAEIISSENPDIILLQELDVDSKKTDYEDQLEVLLSMISPEYTSHTSCWYWRALFVPHPKIMGRAGLKLAIISKFKISSARRHQLPLMPNNFIVESLNFKRAILEAEIETVSGKTFTVMSTHLDAFAQGSDTMQKQVQYTAELLKSLQSDNREWVIGGDFNLVPPGQSYSLLPEDEKRYFQRDTEMALLYNLFQVYPQKSDIDADKITEWFTHFPNRQNKPDRIIDYIITSETVTPVNYYIRSKDTLDISDHFPFIFEFEIK
ncbi:MAG: endonuclease/exonuclease/phosphatase family protein [Spirochaetes bacterium]|jgi:endonuclease/exonuclease/phosphatase family metal-dependent hydrolase|nr:endonuclease/exonuclease/phosphatase family protein [Spirochaetota bacterium]